VVGLEHPGDLLGGAVVELGAVEGDEDAGTGSGVGADALDDGMGHRFFREIVLDGDENGRGHRLRMQRVVDRFQMTSLRTIQTRSRGIPCLAIILS
jgi:hypothetical protein